MNIMDSALEYCKMGFSVIPVKPGGKKPLVKWEPYQSEKASEDQIRAWWKKIPSANVAIVTGAISGMDVVDIDSATGLELFEDMIPDSLETPIT